MENEAPRFEVLEGLPPYGPRADPFPVNGRGSHREGFVVRFFPTQGDSWVGNLQPGLSSFRSVERHPDGRRLAVISGGQGYIVAPDQRGSAEEIGSWYDSAVAAHGVLLLCTPIDIELIASEGTRWRSRRISWDGLRNIRVAADVRTVQGEALTLEDEWVPFEIDMRLGVVTGGSYNGP